MAIGTRPSSGSSLEIINCDQFINHSYHQWVDIGIWKLFCWLRYGGGRTRSRKRAGREVQTMQTLSAAVHGMSQLARLLSQKGGGKAAEGEGQQIDFNDL